MGMGLLRGERSGVAEAMEEDDTGGGDCLSSTLWCKVREEHGIHHRVHGGHGGRKKRRGLWAPAKFLPHKPSWRLKPRGSALRYGVRGGDGSLGACGDALKRAPTFSAVGYCAWALTFRGAVSSIA
jgi:hypothetical protein